MKRISLSIKVAILGIAAMVVSAATGIITSAAINAKNSTDVVNSRLIYSADESSHEINDAILKVGTVVEEVKLLAETRITSTADLANHGETIQSPLGILREVFHLAAVKTELVSGYWLVLNPEYTGLTETDENGDGFFWTKNNVGEFANHPVTNTLKYGVEEKEHSCWWFESVEAKLPLWMDPYYNANIKRNVVSYTIPFYSDTNALLGVVGADLDFKSMVNVIESRSEYKTGHCYLLNEKHLLLTHPEYTNIDEDGHYHSQGKYLSDLISEDAHLHSDTTYQYKYRNTKRIAAFAVLHNGWIFGLSATRSELYQAMNVSIAIPIIVYVAVTVMLAVLLIMVMNYIFAPVKELNKAITRVSYGDLDVHVMSKRKDEIGDLTNSFEEMILNLRSEKSAMNALAFQDGLTGVKNKVAQEEKVAELNNKIRNGTARFAVVMCDVDNLKVINDSQGHMRGDQAIRGACLALCHCFTHSAVYRIGGDEFVAILESKDYDDREALFKRIQKENYTDETGTYKFSVGMATFKQGIDPNYQSVFNRADEHMYEMKKKSKEEQ